MAEFNPSIPNTQQSYSSSGQSLSDQLIAFQTWTGTMSYILHSDADAQDLGFQAC